MRRYRTLGTKVCPQCRKKFPYDTHHPDVTFCSYACLGASKRLPEKACEECKTAFKPTTRTARFCSCPCKYRAHRRAMADGGNPAWGGGVAYRKEFKAVISPRMRKNARCEVCRTRKDLVVHHRNRDHRDDQQGNHAVVCRACHNRIHGKVNGTKFR